MSDVQGSIVEPYVCFDRDRADGEGGVEGDGSPVVVVGVEGFGDYALCQVGRVGVLRAGLGVGEDLLERLGEGDVGLGGDQGCREGCCC